MKHLVLIPVVLLTACSSRSIKPDVNAVKVSRDAPRGNCKEMGTISGTTISAKGSQDEAVEDLKKEAAHKGANYVQVKQFSSYGTYVTGLAYECI